MSDGKRCDDDEDLTPLHQSICGAERRYKQQVVVGIDISNVLPPV